MPRVDQNTIKELSSVKALFQQRAVVHILSQKPIGSKPDQDKDKT